jgi:enoyl-CoA hydratase/carnithine racemase
MTTYSSLPNKLASAVNGIDYAYRDAGEGPVPLVLLQHFRGNLDNWDPALINALASTRRVVAFDNAGVGGSTGTTPHVIEQMAHDAIAFLTGRAFPAHEALRAGWINAILPTDGFLRRALDWASAIVRKPTGPCPDAPPAPRPEQPQRGRAAGPWGIKSVERREAVNLHAVSIPSADALHGTSFG